MKNKSIKLTLHADQVTGKLDLQRFSLGQGGFSADPMIEDHCYQLKQLKPRIIRFFIQEYFDLYPAKGKYNWTKLDKMFRAILDTGAKPLPAICFKPKRLFPELNHDIVEPSSYPEWDKLIYELVKHCKQQNFGIEYWEVGNEPNAGDPAGCPYRFTPENYVKYYKHTATAILKADPGAKVGGPALARWFSPIGDELIKYCGENNFPLHFFSWHLYNDDTEIFREGIRKYKKLLGQYPCLKNTETMITEWNQSLSLFNHNPYFQPAHILEVTKIYEEEGLSQSAYYHIRDYYFDRNEFGFIGEKWVFPTVEQLFNINSHLGIYDNQGRCRPSYYVFKCMSEMTGDRVLVDGCNADVKSFASKNSDEWHNAVFWNFPSGKKQGTYECTLTLKSISEGRYKLMRFNSGGVRDNVEEVQHGLIQDLKKKPIQFTLPPYEIMWLQFFKVPEEKGAVTLGHATARKPSAT